MKKLSIFILILSSLSCSEAQNPTDDNDNMGLVFGEVMDLEGNKYQTVKIGKQFWMTENLKASKFSNGDLIQNLKTNNDWEKTRTPAWSYQNNNELNNLIHGKLYNWYTIDDSRNCCPDGWRIPDDNDFKILTDFLGGESLAGGKLKQKGTTNWLPPNIGATNESGFNALPSAYRYSSGGFDDFGSGGGFWVKSSTVKMFVLRSDNSKIELSNFGTKNGGVSIRCIKNN
jgi:uncharacterized protein (TIGR02145 family)